MCSVFEEIGELLRPAESIYRSDRSVLINRPSTLCKLCNLDLRRLLRFTCFLSLINTIQFACVTKRSQDMRIYSTVRYSDTAIANASLSRDMFVARTVNFICLTSQM